MARLHSKKGGKSGRKRQKSKTLPGWVKADRKEIEDVIIKLAKEGVPPAKIGMILRDQYAIPEVRPFLGMKLNVFLKKNNVGPAYPEDFLNLLKRAVRMHKHLRSSNKDVHNKTKYLHVVSKINRVAKYLKAKGVLQSNWKYEFEQAELLVK
jgi:small subunit ribosomal protein S15